jgi:hypothetical protein
MTWLARRGWKKAFIIIAQSLMEELNVLKLPLLPNTIKEKWGGWVFQELRLSIAHGPLDIWSINDN